jgi:hypothetical protein
VTGGTHIAPPEPKYEQLYHCSVEVVFSAESAAAAKERITEVASSMLNIEAVWEVVFEFDEQQKTETVDA